MPILPATVVTDQSGNASHDHEDDLHAICSLLGEDFPDIANLFMLDGQRRLDTLVSAMNEDDPATVMRTSHTLCGSAASIGADELARCCRELEMTAKTSGKACHPQLLKSIQKAYAHTVLRLQNLLAQQQASGRQEN